MSQQPIRAEQPFGAAGERIRALREAKGLSRRDLADHLKVNVTSLVGWEGGRRIPREGVRVRLARILGTDAEALFATEQTNGNAVAVSIFDTVNELNELLLDLTRRSRGLLKALRLAAPYGTAAHVQTEWRQLISERVLAGSLEVQRIEVFYDLRRLQEVLANIIRYEGRRYFVKSHCGGLGEVMPAIGGYYFDDEEFLLGAYWTGVPPHNKPSLRLSGTPFRTFFNAYWDEIWSRGTFLNIRGAHDLSAVKSLAVKLGLAPEDWDRFIDEARTLAIGDGAPPLI